jgi:hypothetical protein
MEKENEMATATECFGCGAFDEPRSPRGSIKAVLNVVAAIAVAFALMYVEMWAIEQAPAWSDASLEFGAVESGVATRSGNDTMGGKAAAPVSRSEPAIPLPDTAGPVAVLH